METLYMQVIPRGTNRSLQVVRCKSLSFCQPVYLQGTVQPQHSAHPSLRYLFTALVHFIFCMCYRTKKCRAGRSISAAEKGILGRARFSQLAAGHWRPRSQRGRKGNPNRWELTPRSTKSNNAAAAAAAACSSRPASGVQPPEPRRSGEDPAGSIHTTGDRGVLINHTTASASGQKKKKLRRRRAICLAHRRFNFRRSSWCRHHIETLS
jgi:hypothetical protein